MESILMRKISFLLIALAIMLLCTSCGENKTSSVDSSISIDSSSKSEKNITENDAVKIIIELIGDDVDDDKLIIECEGTYDIDNVEYYTIHAYSLSSLPTESEVIKMTFTYGWYYVNKANGKAFENYVGADEKLIPMN